MLSPRAALFSTEMAEAGQLIANALGIGCFAAIVAAGLYFLVTRARAAGVLAPVVVGTLLRLGVMVIAHAGSVSLGEGGFMHLDDAGYAAQAEGLASVWRDGLIVDPAAHDFVGSYQFGFPVLVATVFTLVGNEVLAAKLVNVLAGAGTILITGLIAKDVLGESAGRRTAWLVALAPGVIWWSAPMLKEAVATFLVVAAILAILRLPRSLAVLTALIAVLLVVRSASAAVLIACLGVGLLLAARRADKAIAWRAIGLSALAGLTVAGAVLLVISRGDILSLFDSYAVTLERMIDRYQGSDPTMVPFDTLKSFVTPIPWAYDLGTRSWDRGLYPGMWVWYAVYPLAALGCWRLRRRPELALIALVVLLTIALSSFSSGFVFRQRSTVEPLILVLACAGMASWRVAARLGAASLLIVAVVATVQSGSAPVGVAIAAGALVLLAGAQLLPADDLRRPLPPSPLVRVITTSYAPRPMRGLLRVARLFRDRARAVRPRLQPVGVSGPLGRLPAACRAALAAAGRAMLLVGATSRATLAEARALSPESPRMRSSASGWLPTARPRLPTPALAASDDATPRGARVLLIADRAVTVAPPPRDLVAGAGLTKSRETLRAMREHGPPIVARRGHHATARPEARDRT